MSHKRLPSKTSKLSYKLRYAFDLVGIKVKLVNVSLGLDEQYDYKSMISVMPEGIWVGEFRHPKLHKDYKYDIYLPNGDELNVYHLFSRMFYDLVSTIINDRLNTIEDPPEEVPLFGTDEDQ